jgi:hypothetical protein
MQTEISTAEPLLPEPRSVGIKITSLVFSVILKKKSIGVRSGD